MQAMARNMFFNRKIRLIGYISRMDDYERRKLGIFNLLNVVGFLIGICLPVIGLFISDIQLPVFAWVVSFSPAMVSLLVLVVNYFKKHELAALCYFIMYPILTALVYEVSFDIGIELFFILYGVLSVFFLQRLIFIVISISLTLSCYFYFFVFNRHYSIYLVNINFPFYVLNHLLPAAFIFYALMLIKKESNQYQLNILSNNRQLHRVNLEIKKQKEVIDEKARLLEEKNELIDEKAKLLQRQKAELTELNSMKNKLFSVISHDLKTPLYAIRNLFKSMEQYDIPGDEIKVYIPEVIKDLNYTTALMENLLTWVKSQMQLQATTPQLLKVSDLVKETTDLLRLQATTKNIALQTHINNEYFVYADKEMTSLVMRNLLTNAIKYTPEAGAVSISATQCEEYLTVSITDNGVGIEPSVLNKLFENSYYSTKGTANETGTGIGLMLCKEFLVKNGGSIQVKSEQGKGSCFSFSLPRKKVA